MDREREAPTLSGLRQLAASRGYASGGFFDPDGVFWRVNREQALIVGGMRALLLQIAHPKVAQGVGDHSHFRQDPLGRARRTFAIVNAILFGTVDEALAAAGRMRAVHQRVRGRLPEPLPGNEDPAYAATDQPLQLWVYATLIDSARVTYQQLFHDLPAEEWEAYYQESKLFALLSGIDERMLPARLADFERWVEQLTAGNTLTVTPIAQAIARSLLYGSLPAWLLLPVNYLFAARLLPARLRQSFGLRWGPFYAVLYRALLLVVRLVVRLLPARLRIVPEARQAERRRSSAGGTRRTTWPGRP